MAIVIQILIAFLASPRPEIVTAASENIETVATMLSSVRPQTDTASNPNVTVPITPCPKVTVESINKCEDMLCRKDAGNFVINTTKCPARTPPVIDTAPATVRIVASEIFSTQICMWRFIFQRTYIADVTIDQRVLDTTHPYRILQFEAEFSRLERLAIYDSTLKSRSVYFATDTGFTFLFRGEGHLCPGTPITIHFHVRPGTVALPVTRLTDAVGYVTSPRYDGLHSVYLQRYNGYFHLQVSDNEFVLIKFIHFTLQPITLRPVISPCSDYLEFNASALNHRWKKCGTQIIPSRVYRSSIHLFFHTDKKKELTGFKMVYAIFPRSQQPQPQELSDNLYNCSVPRLHIFKPLLGCNMVRECQGNEDEKGCSYASTDCGDGALDAGTKCYRFVRREGFTTWNEASSKCTEGNERLVTLATRDEVARFRQIMATVKDPRTVVIGAQLLDNIQFVIPDALYKRAWQWRDGRKTIFSQSFFHSPHCGFYNPLTNTASSDDCHLKRMADVLCEFSKPTIHSVNKTEVHLVSSISIEMVWKISMVQCPSGHVTMDLLSCDIQGQCGAKEFMTSCHSENVTVSMFVCENSHETLHYTLVCDRIQHCADNTDEDFCQFYPCSASSFQCQNGQCIALHQECNGKSDCYDGSDETCTEQIRPLPLISQPAVLRVDGIGHPDLREMKNSDECPLTHFQCSQGHCLPIYLRCNGVDDCPNREDEASCESYTCSGFYRCRGSNICLPPDRVCDGVFQCPQFDDELLCEKPACPDVCQCQGLAFVCTVKFSVSSYPDLRYLDASGSGISPSDLSDNHLLIHLRLSDCRIDTQPILMLPNLRHLDLSGNGLKHIDMKHFHSLNNLRVLVLSGNPLLSITNTESPELGMVVLKTINLSNTSFSVFNGSALAGCPNLKTLNISWSKLTTIADDGFQSTPLLENLDVRGSPLKDYPTALLRSLVSLKVVHTDNYKLCCEAMLPEDLNLNKCHVYAMQDLLASCKELLKSNVYRVFLWLFASLSVVGNVGSFVARLYLVNKGAGLSSFNIFVSNLSMADFFMGVYLAIVGVADQIYRGKYLWHDDQWKESTVCKIAGFLSLMSSEVSAFIICLITLDRFLALRFPFSRLHFSRGSALMACTIVWVVGIVLATVPLLPVTSHWEFYSQTGICIPLPFTTSKRFHGYDYSFSVMIILNFVLFLLIAVGQAFIYWSVRSNSISSSKKTGSRDTTVARRLTIIVLSDFLCWFPIGLLGVLASTGTPISDELNVAVAIFVMPFNSALNPFLYTFNVLMEKRQKAQEMYLLKRLETEMCTEQSDAVLKVSLTVNKSTATELIKSWYCEQVLTKEDILSCGSVKEITSVSTQSVSVIVILYVCLYTMLL